MPAPRAADLGLRRQVATPLVRNILAHAKRYYLGQQSVENVIRQLWPRDQEALYIARAATSPAALSTTGWAPELGWNVVSDLMVSLGPASAGSELLRRSNILSLGRYASVKIPALVASVSNASFEAEAEPIPIRQLDTSKSVTLTPKKFATGFSLSREIIESSNAEALVRMVMVNSVALSLDAALFSSAAATAAAPPGLLNGIAALNPAGVAGDSLGNLRADLGSLAAAVAPIGALDLVFVASPGEAVKILGSVGPRFNFPVLASSGLPAKTVACFAPIAIVAAADPQPTIRESREAVVDMQTAPSDITGGSPSPAIHAVSMFQVDSSAFALVFDVTWGLLNPGGAAWMSGVNW